MRTVSLQSVIDWCPCADFPDDRIRELFAGRDEISFADIFVMDIGLDEKLWAGLRECFFTADVLAKLADEYIEILDEIENTPEESVHIAIQAARCARSGHFDNLPVQDQTQRWMSGATEQERRTGIAALWTAVAMARSSADHDSAWETERTRQLMLAAVEVCNAD